MTLKSLLAIPAAIALLSTCALADTPMDTHHAMGHMAMHSPSMMGHATGRRMHGRMMGHSTGRRMHGHMMGHSTGRRMHGHMMGHTTMHSGTMNVHPMTHDHGVKKHM